MNDKNDFDMSSDDDFYDEALDDNFEFDDVDEDLDEIDLDAEFADGDFDSGLDDEWDDDESDDEYEDDFQPINEKKKIGLNFNTIVIAGAVVIGGLVMFTQLNKKPDAEYGSAKVERFATALKMQGNFKGPGSVDEKKIAAEEGVKVVNDGDANQDGGFLFDENILDAEDVAGDMPPMPSPIATDQENADQQLQVTNISDLTADVNDETSSKDSQTPNPPPVETKNIAEEDKIFSMEDITEKMETVKGDAEAEVKELVENIVPEIKTKLEAVVPLNKEPVKQISELNKKPEVNTVDPKMTSVQSQPASDSLDTKLDSIIQRLESMDNKIEQIEMSNNSQIKDIVADIESLKTNKSTRVASSQPKSQSKPKPAPKKAVRKKAPRKASTASWELRAAQPGKAWVSKKGQSNMQPIVVGDNLSGIGRIQDITYTNGKWIVRGNAGKITQ